MTIQIDVESADVITKTKKDNSGTYFQQRAYAHLIDKDGNPSRYPKEFLIFVSKDQNGQPLPYQVGKYTVNPSSFKCDNYGNLELGFLSLRPLSGKS